MQDYTISLDAGIEHKLAVNGDYFQVMEAASPLYFLFDHQGAYMKRQQGQGNGVEPYGHVTIKSDVAQSVRVSLGFVGNASPVNGAGSFTGSVSAQFGVPNQAHGIAAVSIPANSSGVIAAANAQRLALRLSIASDAAGAVLLAGPAEAAAGVGGLVEPGTTDYLAMSGKVTAYNPNAAAVSVYVLELNKV